MSIWRRALGQAERGKPRFPKVLHAMELLLVEQEKRGVERDRDLDWEYEHIKDAASYAKTLAERRRVNPDMAACAAALQNIGRITTGRTEGHADAGYEPARRLLIGLGCFSPAEVEQLAASVRRHSRKDVVDSPLDEVVKDVDIYVRYIHGLALEKPGDLKRLASVKLELQHKPRS
jgi:HD superfamily phosphodiesterase